MKNLFVTHKIEKDEKKDFKLLIGKCKPEEKKDKLDLSLSPMNSESTKFSQSLKSNSHDMPIISRKETLNALSTDNSFSFDLKNASSFDDKNIKQKSFLGKKRSCPRKVNSSQLSYYYIISYIRSFQPDLLPSDPFQPLYMS